MCLICLGTLEKYVTNVDGTFCDVSSHSNWCIFDSLTEHLGWAMNSLLWQDTFGQILSCIIKSEHPISVHCFLRRLIEFTDLNAHFIIRKMLK